MRLRVIIIFLVLIVALLACAVASWKSKRSIASDVRLLLGALVVPIFGNLLIVMSSDWLVSTIGCYIYYIGLDFTVILLLRFTCDYCMIRYQNTRKRLVFNAIVLCDIVQLLLNPVFGHAFTTTPVVVDGALYYSLVPLAGQVVHRVVAYGIFFVSVGVFFYKTVTASRIYIERYLVILLALLLAGIWESYYIFSGVPIDRSMISFGFFGLLIYFLALHYRPMRLLDRMLSRVVTSLHTAVFFFEGEGTCIYANDKARALVGIGEDDEIPDNINESIESVIGGWRGKFNEEWHSVVTVGNGDEARYYDVGAMPVTDDDGRSAGASLTIRDATEEELKLRREKLLATRDTLTGLYNQRYLYEQARVLLDENPDVDFRVVGIDIKDFKIINDIFDKDFGDRVLCVLADVMRSNAVPSSVYGRLSGDKFAFFAPADSFTEEELEALLDARSYGDRIAFYPIVAHMGIYDIVERDVDVSVMVDRAFMAIGTIKNDYKRHIAVYDDKMRDDLIWSQSISAQLDAAIEERQLQPYLQPLVNEKGHVEGAEVLVRWIHPTEGFLSPARFIPIFERNGMIAQLDEFMWRRACEILHDWEKRGIDLFLSVNISPKDFYFIDVYETINSLVREHGIDSSKLRLEITETVMMSEVENRLRIIEDLRDDGFLVEMDDFGSGYSSLNMLKDIPVDILKIDMMFLYKTKSQEKAKTILKSIIGLSGSLGMTAIAEGVETADQLDMLVNMGCRNFQGFYFSKPMPLEDFEKKYRAA